MWSTVDTSIHISIPTTNQPFQVQLYTIPFLPIPRSTKEASSALPPVLSSHWAPSCSHVLDDPVNQILPMFSIKCFPLSPTSYLKSLQEEFWCSHDVIHHDYCSVSVHIMCTWLCSVVRSCWCTDHFTSCALSVPKNSPRLTTTPPGKMINILSVILRNQVVSTLVCMRCVINLPWFKFESGKFLWFYLCYLSWLENRGCLSCGVQVIGATWQAAMCIMTGVWDLVQRTGDGQAQVRYSVAGRSGG
jgi:hypothetical protein